MTATEGIGTLLSARAASAPDSIALLDSQREPMTGETLRRQCDLVREILHGLGIGPGRRVAVVVPNGAELATAVLAVSSCATAAPLNASYTATELHRYLAAIGAEAVVAQAPPDAPVHEVAAALGIPLVALSVQPGSVAGAFALEPRAVKVRPVTAVANDCGVALVLHTSGTTSDPKIVALSHRRLCASAATIARWYDLGADDRCLAQPPYFHIHGIVAGLLASLISGGSTICGSGFEPRRLLADMVRLRPTWYTGVPAAHRALAVLAAGRTAAARTSLRFIRSSSATLPVPVMEELENRFGAPVLEAYGMTEAAHQIASNPLPPAPRKAGSVGLPTGVEVKVVADSGAVAAAGQHGEVMIRGPAVIDRYQGTVGGDAFVDGWFRTGDQGILDEDGYLTLTGRIKEMINRGGEKISPQEIEAGLFDHPDVAEAVCYAVPHPSLGDDVGAAVVLREGAKVDCGGLREHLRKRLASFKVPRNIRVVAEIPRNATGKVQRIGMAGRLAAVARKDSVGGVGPDTDGMAAIESDLAGIWHRVLGREVTDRHADFISAGGDSLQAVTLVHEIERQFGVTLSLEQLMDEDATIATVAGAVAGAPKKGAVAVPIAAAGDAGLPAAFSQQSFWVLSRLLRGDPRFNVCVAMSLDERVTPEVVSRALAALVDRHRALRTRLALRDGALVQEVMEPWRDGAAVTTLASDEEPSARMRECAQRPIEIIASPLMRADYLDRRGGGFLLLTMHHAIADGWSREIVLRDLAAIVDAELRQREPGLEPIALQFGDFAAWQRRLWDDGDFRADLAYWRARLDGCRPLRLEGDGPVSEIPDWRGRALEMPLPADLTEAVGALARERRSTPFMVLLSAFLAWLHERTGEDDLAVGVPTANRTDSRLRSVVGNFMNPVLVRVTVTADLSFSALLERVRSAALAAIRHGQAPFDRLVGELGLASRLGVDPVFPVSFQLRSYLADRHRRDEGAQVVRPYPFDPGITQFDLAVELEAAARGLRSRFIYRTELFREATVAAMMNRYLRVLDQSVRMPDRALPLNRGSAAGDATAVGERAS